MHIKNNPEDKLRKKLNQEYTSEQEFTAVNEITKIKVLNTEEIENLSDKNRDLVLKDTLSHVDTDSSEKYQKNIKKIIISGILISLFFVLLIAVIVLLFIYLFQLI
ncbi:UNVERIFIED_CONTAM: hypothetical protein O8I53_12020 [Campylobacter lari]